MAPTDLEWPNLESMSISISALRSHSRITREATNWRGRSMADCLLYRVLSASRLGRTLGPLLGENRQDSSASLWLRPPVVSSSGAHRFRRFILADSYVRAFLRTACLYMPQFKGEAVRRAPSKFEHGHSCKMASSFGLRPVTVEPPHGLASGSDAQSAHDLTGAVLSIGSLPARSQDLERLDRPAVQATSCISSFS